MLQRPGVSYIARLWRWRESYELREPHASVAAGKTTSVILSIQSNLTAGHAAAEEGCNDDK